MDRNNLLERRLLARCYSSRRKVSEILESRYASPSLFLIPTRGSDEVSTSTKSLLHRDKPVNDGISVERKTSTRADFKQYIHQTMRRQKQITKRVAKHYRKQGNDSLNIDKLLDQYQIPKFEDYFELNNLWQKYMHDLLFNNTKAGGSSADTKDGSSDVQLPSMAFILPKLSSAEYVGCLVTVLRSHNANLNGVRGIVLWDAQHSFIVVSPRGTEANEYSEVAPDRRLSPSELVGGLKILPKKGTLFAFDIVLKDSESCLGCTVVGSRFEIRSVDRAGKKFKSHNVSDI